MFSLRTINEYDDEFKQYMYNYIDKYTKQVFEQNKVISSYKIKDLLNNKFDKFLFEIKKTIIENINEKDKTLDDLIEDNSLVPMNLNVLEKYLNNFKKKICFVCYTNEKLKNWDPDSINQGIAGSEEAVIYLTEELAKLNIKVDVYCSPKNDVYSNIFQNPRYLPIELYLSDINNEFYDCCIMWRNFDLNLGKLRSDKVFCWLHDITIRERLPNFDLYLLLSNFHLSKMLEFTFDKPKTLIIGNGIKLEDNQEKKRKKHTIGYFSNYSRGLEILLNIWDDICESIPDVELHIYYGRETWGTMSQEKLDLIVLEIQKYKNIYEYGMISHSKLHEAMRELSIWAYPCINESETFCITAIKSQYYGMIPVVNRIGALKETVAECPSLNYEEIHLDSNEKFQLEYLDLLKQTILNEDKYDRNIYKNFAKEYTWENVANKLEKFF